MAVGERPGEFELIDRYFRPLATDVGTMGLTDDAAFFRAGEDEDIVITADLVAAGVHFFPDDPPRSIARKALRVNLSDLAGKGAAPSAYLLTLALPADWTEAWIAEFTAALKEDQARYRVALLGGDTSRASGGTTISITALGRLPRGAMIHRAGAHTGDIVYVSGTIGDAALGLRLRQGLLSTDAAGEEGSRYLVARFLEPEPRVDLGPAVRVFATAAMDVSDGLIGDLGHICKASRVGAEIDATAVPLSPAARAVIAADPAALEVALTGGDDYEILATVPPTSADTFVEAAKEAGVPVTPIGRIVEGEGAPVVLDGDRRPIRFARSAYDHFGKR